MMKILLLYLLIVTPVLFIHCTDDEGIDRNVYEGELIPGTEVFFPMGYLGGPQLLPKVSPDSRYLVYQNFYADGQTQGLWILDMQTGHKRLLIEGGYAPDWSPDGEWIAFNLGTQIYKIKSDGSDLTQLTFEGENFYPDWSADSALYFFSNMESETGLKFIWKMDSYGNEKSRIDFEPTIGEHLQPDVSFDKNQIAHIRYIMDGPPELFIMDTTAQSIQRLTHNNEFETYPRFSPNNPEIVFFNNEGIYLLETKTKEIVKLLDQDQHDLRYPSRLKRLICCPSWYPDGEHIVYQRFEVKDAERGIDGTEVEGHLAFYKLNVDSAMTNFK